MDNSAALKALFPSYGISVGYIGNCGVNFDDRSWRVWTNLKVSDDDGSASVNGLGQRSFQVYIDGPGFDLNKVAKQIRAAAARLAYRAADRRDAAIMGALVRG